MKTYRILVINPGSTSTKIALFDNLTSVLDVTLRHSGEELSGFRHIAEQFSFRKNLILDTLGEHGIDTATISAVIGRGGLVHPIPSGVYEINDKLKADMKAGPMGEHASNLGGLLAEEIAAGIKEARAFIADPVVVDEMDEVAHMSGHPLLPRRSIFHALNQKAVARRYAESIGKRYDELNLIVAHMGGGISVGAHRRGRVVDVNNTLDGEGPFSPERSGSLPAGQLAELCFSGKYGREEVRRMISGKGGVMAHLGTNNIKDAVDKAMDGDERARLVIDAMAYNVGKWIGMQAAVLHGEVDAIIITGGIAHSGYICGMIEPMVRFIAHVEVMPGEDEMLALAENALMVLRGEVRPLEYAPAQ